MKKLISICITTLLLSSCSGDFLDLAPQHTGSESTFFKTEEHFTQAINGAYQRLRDVHGVYGTLMSEMRADNTISALRRIGHNVNMRKWQILQMMSRIL